MPGCRVSRARMSIWGADLGIFLTASLLFFVVKTGLPPRKHGGILESPPSFTSYIQSAKKPGWLFLPIASKAGPFTPCRASSPVRSSTISWAPAGPTDPSPSFLCCLPCCLCVWGSFNTSVHVCPLRKASPSSALSSVGAEVLASPTGPQDPCISQTRLRSQLPLDPQTTPASPLLDQTHRPVHTWGSFPGSSSAHVARSLISLKICSLSPSQTTLLKLAPILSTLLIPLVLLVFFFP